MEKKNQIWLRFALAGASIASIGNPQVAQTHLGEPKKESQSRDSPPAVS